MYLNQKNRFLIQNIEFAIHFFGLKLPLFLLFYQYILLKIVALYEIVVILIHLAVIHITYPYNYVSTLHYIFCVLLRLYFPASKFESDITLGNCQSKMSKVLTYIKIGL